MMRVNLLPRSYQLARRRRVHIQRCTAAGCAWLTILGAVVGVARGLLGSDLRSISAELSQVESVIATTKTDASQREARLRAQRGILEANDVAGRHPDWSILLGVIASRSGEHIALDRVKLGPSGSGSLGPDAKAKDGVTRPDHVVRIEGRGESQTAIADMVLGLEACGLFSKVKLVATRGSQRQEQRFVGFEIECVLVGSKEAPKEGAQ